MKHTKTNNEQTKIVFGGITGYVNTAVELKISPSNINYLCILLGRGRDVNGNDLASYSIAFFGRDAERFASQIKKGDLIRITSVILNPTQQEGKTYATHFTLIGKDAVLIGQSTNPAPKTTGTSPRTFGDLDQVTR